MASGLAASSHSISEPGRRRALADGRAEVARVAHQQQRGDGFQGVEQAEHAALAVAHGKGKRFHERAFERQPERRRVHFVFGQFELSVADVFVGEKFDFLEADHLRSNQHVAVGARGLRVGAARLDALARRAFQHAHLRIANGVGVVVHIDALHVRFALLEIQRLDVELLPLVQINGLGMNRRERAREIHFADHFGRSP